MYPKWFCRKQCICHHVQINPVIVIVVNYFPSSAAVKRGLSILCKDRNVKESVLKVVKLWRYFGLAE